MQLITVEAQWSQEERRRAAGEQQGGRAAAAAGAARPASRVDLDGGKRRRADSSPPAERQRPIGRPRFIDVRPVGQGTINFAGAPTTSVPPAA